MIITTTNSIEGRKVSAYKGLIMSDAILGANVFRDIFAGLRDFFGGRSGSYEKTLKEAPRDAMAELEEVVSLYATNSSGQPAQLRLWISAAWINILSA